jgi:hypothetical protein
VSWLGLLLIAGVRIIAINESILFPTYTILYLVPANIGVARVDRSRVFSSYGGMVSYPRGYGIIYVTAIRYKQTVVGTVTEESNDYLCYSLLGPKKVTISSPLVTGPLKSKDYFATCYWAPKKVTDSLVFFLFSYITSH